MSQNELIWSEENENGVSAKYAREKKRKDREKKSDKEETRKVVVFLPQSIMVR